MKRVVIFLILGITSSLFGQEVFMKKTTLLNFGLGVGQGYVRYWGVGYSSTPYINVSFDHGVYDFPDVKGLSVGLGGYFGWRRTSYTFIDSWRDRHGRWHYSESVTSIWNYMELGFRPTIHYSFEGVKAEVYAGLPMGYTFVSHRWSNPDYNGVYYSRFGNFFGIGFQLGGRYFFSDRFGVFLEFGYFATYANLGVSLKL